MATKVKGMHQKARRTAAKTRNGGLLRRITVNPKVLVGKPTIRGLRISVEQILNLLGQGMTHTEILAEFPVLEEDDIRAALQYAHRLMAVEKVYNLGQSV